MMEVVELVVVSSRERRLTSKIGFSFSFDIKTKHNAAVEVRRRETMMAMVGIERAAILLGLINMNVYFRDDDHGGLVFEHSSLEIGRAHV